MTRFTGDFKPLDYLDQQTMALPFHLIDRPGTLVLGAGGGDDVLRALYHRASPIDVVELNRQMVDLVDREFGEFTGRIYERLGVTPHAYRIHRRAGCCPRPLHRDATPARLEAARGLSRVWDGRHRGGTQPSSRRNRPELRLERTRSGGQVIEVRRRNAAPGGGFVLIYSDITGRKRSEAEAHAARHAAEAAYRDLKAARPRRWPHSAS